MKPPKDLTAEIIDNLLATDDKTRRLLEAARQRLAVPPEAPGQNETAHPRTPTKTTAAAGAKPGASQIMVVHQRPFLVACQRKSRRPAPARQRPLG